MENTIKKIKKLPLILLLTLFIGGAISGTFAFFTSSEVYTGIFDASKYNVKITEEFNNEFGTKKVNFVNDGSVDVLIRINYNEYWTKVIGNDNVSLSNTIDGKSLVNKNWTEEFNNNFTYYNGWYYYNKLLKGNSSIQILTDISLNSDLINKSNYKNEYDNADYDLDFNLESIQASIDSADKIWGVSMDINGDDILWQF